MATQCGAQCKQTMKIVVHFNLIIMLFIDACTDAVIAVLACRGAHVRDLLNLDTEFEVI